jgi:hypothetical protein
VPTTSMQGPSTCALGQRHHREHPPPPRRPTLLGGKPRPRRSRLHRRPRRLRVHRLRQAPRSERGRRSSAAGILAALRLAGQTRLGWQPVLFACAHLERRSWCVPTAGPIRVPQPRRHALELAGAESVHVERSEWAVCVGCGGTEFVLLRLGSLLAWILRDRARGLCPAGRQSERHRQGGGASP